MKNRIAPLRILVVDDDALSREVLALLLRHVGYSVDAADSGDAAMHHLKVISGPPPDVVLADMQMPGTSGGALARELRDLCGGATKLLAMSGSLPDDESIREFDGLLLKPFTTEELTAAIAPDRVPAEHTNEAVHRNLTVLDETTYKKLAGSMRSERLEQLYALSLSDTEDRIISMQQAVSNKDDASFRKQAHAISGGCGMVGAIELHTLAASMEENGIDNNHLTSIAELVVACERLRRILIARNPEGTLPTQEGERAQ